MFWLLVLKTWGADYEVWSHHLFQGNATDPVYLLERWQKGRAQRYANLFPDKLQDFNGNALRALTFHYPPSIEETRHPDGSRSFDGMCVLLLYFWKLQFIV